MSAGRTWPDVVFYLGLMATATVIIVAIIRR